MYIYVHIYIYIYICMAAVHCPHGYICERCLLHIGLDFQCRSCVWLKIICPRPHNGRALEVFWRVSVGRGRPPRGRGGRPPRGPGVPAEGPGAGARTALGLRRCRGARGGEGRGGGGVPHPQNVISDK